MMLFGGFELRLDFEAIPCICCWMICLCIFPMQALMTVISVGALKDGKDFQDFQAGNFFFNLFNMIYLGCYIYVWYIASDSIKNLGIEYKGD